MKKYLLGLFAVVLAVAFSAFTSVNDGTYATTYYFKYIPTADFDEADYETVANWDFQSTSNPGDLCSGANVNPCVVKVVDLVIDPLETEEEALVDFLIARPSAEAYAESSTNITARKP